MEIIREINDKKMITNSQDTKKYLSEFMNQDREHIIVLGLDSKNKVIYREIAGIGCLNSAVIHPREIFKRAVIMSANSIIVAHNHPSGDLEPSPEDRAIKERLLKAGEILDIRLLDFLVFGGKNKIERVN